MTAVAVLLAALLAQAPGPDTLALPGYRLHLVVDESVDADTLRALAGSGTVLWLRTRSNMLRDSTVEAVARFPEAYVQLRPPLLEAQAGQLRRAPRAGAWLDSRTLGTGGAWHHRLGPRKVAVDVHGRLDAETARRVAALRPSRVTWLPEAAEATLAGWGELVQLPGAKVLVLARAVGVAAGAGAEAALASEPGERRTGADGVLGAGPAASPGGGRAEATGSGPSGPMRAFAATCTDEALSGPLAVTRARVALTVEAGAPVAGPPCGVGRRVRVTGPPDDAALVALFSRMPSAELELEVGSSPAALTNARAWVERLEAAVRGSRE
ncbi:hypothetical protein [Pyxidicoccus xibeiensis]|uniref:hypothetical protein n=1 Tax=Pyxidicoccus xibeiensis TaxID=2906759 RepID=UPI0020A7FCCE|nr:hypothetical protein [Pyxidicoccus xibeiensis]MCP3142093.1 hypothetical protein [Pyxidicoccus xibeiensis]